MHFSEHTVYNMGRKDMRNQIKARTLGLLEFRVAFLDRCYYYYIVIPWICLIVRHGIIVCLRARRVGVG